MQDVQVETKLKTVKNMTVEIFELTLTRYPLNLKTARNLTVMYSLQDPQEFDVTELHLHLENQSVFI